MPAKATKRRSPGEGGAYPYQTKAGERFRVKGLVRQVDGTMKEVNKRGFATKTAALEWLGDQQSAGRKGEYLEPSKQKLGDYGREVIDGMRLKPQTRASYAKNWRLHIEAYPVGDVPLAQLTGQKLTAHYRKLETSGRKDHKAGEGLSARTVRYIHTTIHAVLGQAVKDSLLLRNPADAATPPSAREAKAPEMTCWSEKQLGAFLGWAEVSSQNYPLWNTLAYTGMRRGEALSLRWRDIDLERCTIAVRRSAGMVKNLGERAEMVEDSTKSSKPRVIDIDDDTAAVLRAHKSGRGSMALALARPDSLVFGDIEGEYRNGDGVSREFTRGIERCQKVLGTEAVPMIRLHDTRHTHATILLLNGVPVHVVAQRLGHASPVVTLSVYAHVMPGNQRDAANTFAALIRKARTA